MTVKSRRSPPPHRARKILMISLALMGLTACFRQSPATPTSTPAVTPTVGVISPESLPYLSPQKSFGSGIARSAAWSPDGKTLAIVTSLRVDLYDGLTFALAGTLETDQSNTLLKYSPDGKFLAVSGEDGLTQIWEAGPKRRTQTLRSGRISNNNSGQSLAFSPDSTQLITGGDQTIRLWDVTTGQLLDSFPGYLDGIVDAAISPDGNSLFVATWRTIYVRDLLTRELRYAPLEFAGESLHALFVEANGESFISVSESSLYNTSGDFEYKTQIRSWDLITGKLLQEYQAHPDRVYSAAVSSDQQWVALAGETKISIWDLPNKKINASLSVTTNRAQSLAVSPDGQRLAFISGMDGENDVSQVWDLAHQKLLKTFDEYTNRFFKVAFSPLGNLVALAGSKIQIREMAGGQLIQTLSGDSPLAFSPDGKTLAYATGRDTLALVEAGTGKVVSGTIPCLGVKAVAFSPDGKTLASGGENCMAQIWDIPTGKIVSKLDQAQYNDFSKNYKIEDLAFSPDGRTLIVSGYSKIEFWDIQAAKQLKTIGGLEYDARPALSPEGRYVAFNTSEGEGDGELVQVQDINSAQILFRLTARRSGVSKLPLAFSPDGQLLAIGSYKNSDQKNARVEIWDAWTGQPLLALDLASASVKELAFSADGKTLFTVGNDGAIQLWQAPRDLALASVPRPTPTDISTPTLTPTAPTVELKKFAELGRGFISPLARSPNGKLIALIEGEDLKWYDSKTFIELGAIELGDQSDDQVFFSPDSKLAIVGTFLGAQIVELASKKIVGYVGSGTGFTGGYTFSRDGRYMAYILGDRSTGGPYWAIGLWNVTERKGAFDKYGYFPTRLEERYHTMTDPAISPDVKLVAAGHSDKRVYVWDLHTGETRFILEGHAASVSSVDFSPNGQLLASGSDDGTIRLWSSVNGKLVRVLTGFPNDVYNVKFLANGQSLKVGTAGSPELVVDWQTGQMRNVNPPPAATPDLFNEERYRQGYAVGAQYDDSSQALYSPDGRRLALASRNVVIWDVATHELIASLNDTQSNIRGIAFSPDGSQLAVTTDNNRVLAWDIQTGHRLLAVDSDFLSGGTVLYGVGDTELGPARGSSSIAEQGLAFSPDGTELAFGNGHTIEIWNVPEARKVTTLTNPVGSFATQLSFSADGKHLYVIINRNRAAQVWEVAPEKLLRQVDLPHENANAYSAIALNGPLFARNNLDDQGQAWLEVWNLETEQSQKLAMPSAENEPLRFSPDGSLIIALNDNQLYFWQTATGQLIYRTEAEFERVWPAISPDNKTLALVREGKAELWNISPIVDLAQHSHSFIAIPAATVTPIVFAWPSETPNPTPLASPTSPSNLVAIISPENAGQLRELSRFSQGTIEQVAWSPDSTSIALAGSLGAARYDLRNPAGTLAETAQLELQGKTYHTVVLPDGRTLAAGVNAGRVQVWELTSRTKVADLEGGGEPALSPDGNLVVYLDEQKNLRVWDIPQGQVAAVLQGDSPRWPVFSADGKWVAAIQSHWYYYDNIRVWEVRTGKIVNALGGPDNDLTDLSFSADGQFIVGAGGGSAWIWDRHPGTAPETITFYTSAIVDNLNIYTQTVSTAALSPDNQIVAIGATEHTVWLYDRQSQRELHQLEGHSSSIHRLRFSPDGKILLSLDEDGVIILWDVASGQRLNQMADYTGPIRGLVFRTDGNLGAWQAGAAWALHPPDSTLVSTTRPYSGTILAASPAGDWLAVYNPFRVSLWDARTGKFKQMLEGEASDPFVEYYWEGLIFRRFSGAAFSQDGSRLATAGTGGVWFYETQTGRLLQQFPGTDARKIAFNPQGDWLLTSIEEYASSPHVFNLQTGETVFELEGRGIDHFQDAFSPDGRWIGAVTREWDGPYEFNLWDTVSRRVFKQLPLEKDVPALSLAFSPQASLVALGQADGKIRIINLATLKTEATLTGHHGAVTHVAFSLNGFYLASGGEDGTIRLWGIRPN